MIQNVFTRYLIYAETVQEIAQKSCICRSNGWIVRHQVTS